MSFFDTAVSGLNAFQQMINVVGNNISNTNTIGYKGSEINFADLLSQMIQSGSAGNNGGMGGTNPEQVGLGVKVSEVTPVFTPGPLTQTDNPNDLAIDGSGFFVVSPDPNTTPPTLYYTRAGNFNVDSNGYLVTQNGYYLMGSTTQLTPGSTPIWTRINVLDVNGNPAPYTIGKDGTVTVTGGGTYYIPIVNFVNPSGLEKMGDSLYQDPAGGNAGNPSYGPAGNGVYGSIQQGFLESSNVDLSRELSNMLVAQTGYSANAKVIQTQNQMFQSLLQNV